MTMSEALWLLAVMWAIAAWLTALAMLTRWWWRRHAR